MTRAALYARYSSDNQREASIEDQFRLCREHAARERWQIVGLSTSTETGPAIGVEKGPFAMAGETRLTRRSLSVVQACQARLGR